MATCFDRKTVNIRTVKIIFKLEFELKITYNFISNFRFNSFSTSNKDSRILKFNVNNGIPLVKLMNVP